MGVVLIMGVDGAPRGWVGTVWNGITLNVLYRTTLVELFEAAERPSIVAVDMPIGLVETGARRAETSTRAFLGARRSSVFPSPVRAVVVGSDYADYPAANQLARGLAGKGLSRQSFALFPKIDEVARWHESTDVTVCEVHPEVSFQALAGAPLQASKKTPAGVAERRRLLAGVGLLPNNQEGWGWARIDDVLDAAVATWTARRIADGSARSFPADPGPGEPTIWA